jgi:hypothetical protein
MHYSSCQCTTIPTKHIVDAKVISWISFFKHNHIIIYGSPYCFIFICLWMQRWLLGNSGKPVTLETLSLTKFSKHVFQEQGIHDSRKPGTCEAVNSLMCKVRESWFGEEVESRTCGSPESRTVDGPNFGERLVRETVEDPVREFRAKTFTNQLRSEGQFGKLLKTLFGSFTRRHSRTRGEAKSKL